MADLLSCSATASASQDGIDDFDSASVQSFSTDRSYSVVFDSDDEVSDELSDSETGPIQPYMFEPEPANITTEAAVVNKLNNGEEEQRPTRRNNLDWCNCSNCQILQTENENKCCQEIGAINKKIDEIAGISCILEHPYVYSVCLDPYVLDVSWLQYRQQYGQAAYDGPYDQKMRHVAYRQLARWCWGFLGQDVRVALPSCAVSWIRAQYVPPGLEEDATFKGFQTQN